MFGIKIKETFIKILVGMLLILFIGSCSSSSGIAGGPVPLWVTDVNAEYSDSEYLSAVGYAKDRVTAEAEAVANVSKILSQKVKSESTASQVFENNLVDQSRTYETSVTTSSLIDDITGVKIQEAWTAKDNTIYALALIDRKEVGSYYSQKIKENETAINGLINFMIDNEATFEGIASIEKALEIAYENEAYLKLLSVINPSMYKSIDLAYKSARAISVLVQLEKEKIYIGVFVTGDVDKRVANALTASFKASGYKSQSLSSFTAPSLEMPYVLYGELLISPFEMTSTQNNKYVRFTFNSELVDTKNKTFLPWSISGREAHLTESEAEQRAIRTIEDEIEKEFHKELAKIEK